VRAVIAVLARGARDEIAVDLERNRLFVSAALPQRVFPPLFNRYEPGMALGAHVDNAIRPPRRPDPVRIRLEFRLTARDGKVVRSGARDLRYPLYLTRARLLSTDPLRYQKHLLLEWFQREFLSRRYPVPGGATK
jgi:hypothetical protein